MENDGKEFCDYCSPPENLSIGTCPSCKKAICNTHKDSHGCPKETPAPKVEEPPKDDETLIIGDAQDISDDELVDKYNENIEQYNIDVDKENAKKKKIAIGGSVIAMIAVSTIILLAGGTFDPNKVPTSFLDYVENSELISDAELAVKCESWNIEGKEITDRNNASVDYWSQEDYDRAIYLESLILEHCIETVDDILLKLDMCTTTWLDLNYQIDYMMIERIIESLPEDEQNRYATNYAKYHENKCYVVEDTILQEERVQMYIEQRSADGKDIFDEDYSMLEEGLN